MISPRRQSDARRQDAAAAYAVMRKDLVEALTSLTRTPEASLAQAALVIARIEYPDLDAAPYLARLDALGDEARYRIARHVDATRDPTAASRLKVLNTF